MRAFAIIPLLFTLSSTCCGSLFFHYSDDYEIHYEYQTGGMPAGRSASIDMTVTAREGRLTRTETPVHPPGAISSATVQFPMSDPAMRSVHAMLTERGFFRLTTRRVMNYDATTVSLAVRSGRRRHACALTPVTAPGSEIHAAHFAEIERLFLTMMQEHLPAGQKHLLDR